MMKIRHSEPYPPVGAQLDAVMKMAQALQQQGIDIPQETADWIAQCQVVKDRYAKPTETDPVPAHHRPDEPVFLCPKET